MATTGASVLILTMRVLVSGKWENISGHDLSGKTLKQVCQEYAGRDCAAKILLSGSDYYLCGTDKLKRIMLKKGKAMTFSEAIELFGSAAVGVLDMKID
jgi:hypothetical protein